MLLVLLSSGIPGPTLAKMAGSFSNKPASGHVAFTYPNFVLYLIARWLMVVTVEMQSVAVGWHVYDITHKALDLGLVGLAQFLPGILLFLVSGHSADRFDRRRLLTICYVGYTVCSALLFAITISGFRSVSLIYAVMVLVGVVRSFSGPVSRAIMPQLVPDEHFRTRWLGIPVRCRAQTSRAPR